MKKLLFDFFPLILFFIAFRYADIYAATAVAMTASVAQIVWLKLNKTRVETMHWVNLGIILVFGGATLLLHDDAFIKWKPTVLYWLFASALLLGKWLFGRNPIQGIMGQQIRLPDAVWTRLNLAWALFFAASGALNLYIAFSGHFSEGQWVSFKVFGSTVLLVLFVIAQSIWLGRHMTMEAPAREDPAKKDPTDSSPANRDSQ